MGDANAVAVGFVGRDSGFSGAIRGIVGSLGKFSGALKLGAAAALFFGTKAMAEALREATKFEVQVANLAKIVGDFTAEPLARSLQDLSATMPVAKDRLFEVAAAAARLGIRGRKNILEFTRVMAMIDTATDTSADVAAEQFARIAEVTNLPVDKIGNLASVMNELSNTMATSFSEVLVSTGNLAKALAGLDVAPEVIAAIAAAGNEVNISILKGSRQILAFVQQLSDLEKIPKLAELLGITPQEFAVQLNAGTDAVVKLITALITKFKESKQSALEMNNIFDTAARKGVAALAQNIDGVATALALVNKEIKTTASLVEEYERFAGTAAAKSLMLSNQIDVLQTNLGVKLLPLKHKMISFFSDIIDGFNNLTGLMDRVDRVFGADIQRQLEGTFKPLLVDLFTIKDITEGGIRFERVETGKLKRATRILLEGTAALADQLDNSKQVIIFLKRINEFSQEWAEENLTSEQILNRIHLIYSAIVDSAIGLKDATDEVVDTEIDLSKILGGDDPFKGLNLDRVREALDFSGITGPITEVGRDVVDLATNIFKLALATEEGERAARQWELELELITPELARLVVTGERAQEMAKKLAEKKTELSNKIREMNNELLVERVRLEQGDEAARKLQLAIEGITGATAKNIISQEAHIKELEDQKDALEAAEKAARRLRERLEKKFDDLALRTLESRIRLLERVIGDLADSLVDTFEALVTGADSAGEAIVNMIKDIARAIATAGLQSLIFQLISAGLNFGGGVATTGGGGGTTSASDFFSGGFQHGGKMRAGRMGLVGERGPEMFVPNVDGTIVPNSQLGGRVVQINVRNHFTIQALDGESVRDILTQQEAFIAHNTVKQIRRSDLFKQAIR